MASVFQSNIFVDIFDSLAPAIFASGDSIMTYMDKKTHAVAFYLNLFRCVVISALLIYISYLYFYRKEVERTSSNLVDIVILSITLVFILISVYFSHKNMINEKK